MIPRGRPRSAPTTADVRSLGACATWSIEHFTQRPRADLRAGGRARPHAAAGAGVRRQLGGRAARPLLPADGDRRSRRCSTGGSHSWSDLAEFEVVPVLARPRRAARTGLDPQVTARSSPASASRISDGMPTSCRVLAPASPTGTPPARGRAAAASSSTGPYALAEGSAAGRRQVAPVQRQVDGRVGAADVDPVDHPGRPPSSPTSRWRRCRSPCTMRQRRRRLQPPAPRRAAPPARAVAATGPAAPDRAAGGGRRRPPGGACRRGGPDRPAAPPPPAVPSGIDVVQRAQETGPAARPVRSAAIVAGAASASSRPGRNGEPAHGQRKRRRRVRRGYGRHRDRQRQPRGQQRQHRDLAQQAREPPPHGAGSGTPSAPSTSQTVLSQPSPSGSIGAPPQLRELGRDQPPRERLVDHDLRTPLRHPDHA